MYAVYYYNHIIGKLNRYTALVSNPLIEATRDVAGSAMIVAWGEDIELEFTKFALSRLNGSLSNPRAAFHVIYMPIPTSVKPKFQYTYMHRSMKYPILVPRLNQAKPMFWILLDPFDVETWILFSVMMLIVATFRTYCSRRYTPRQFLRSLQDVLLCAVLGTPILFYRQLEQINGARHV